MKKLFICSLIYISCYGRSISIEPLSGNNENQIFTSTKYNSTFFYNELDDFSFNAILTGNQIDSSYKDVVDLMNSVVYAYHKNREGSSKKRIVKKEVQLNNLRYPADSINFSRTGENYFQSKNFLSDKGFDLNFQYTDDAMLNYGIKNMGNVDLKMSLDLNKIIEFKGLKAFVYVLGDFGDKVRNLTGVAQGISNIEAANTWKLYQFWLEQSLFNDKLSVLLGLYDLNAEFDCRDASSIFINPSQAIGPDFSQTGKNGPSIFPNTAMALRVKYNFLNNFTLLSAAFDGVPGDPQNPYGTHVILNRNEGLLITNEISYLKENSTAGGYLKLAAGTWLFTSKFEDLLDKDIDGDTINKDGNIGFYFFGENKIIMGDDSPADAISFYLRSGIADGDVNQFNSYFGGGITFKGLWGRKDDLFGLAFSYAHNSYKYRMLISNTILYPGEVNPFETVWEATYNIQLNSYISVQPDLQYINHPSLNYIHDNFLLSLIRIRFSY